MLTPWGQVIHPIGYNLPLIEHLNLLQKDNLYGAAAPFAHTLASSSPNRGKWHRQGFRIFWKRKSQGQVRQPRIDEQTIALTKRIAVENRRWGTKRIRGELLKLGLRVNRGTSRRYMRQARRQMSLHHTGQSWATFLANHGPQIWACDFLQTYDVFFRTIFLFFIIEHGSRRVIHVAVSTGA